MCNVTFEEYVSMDDEIMTSSTVTDEELINEIKCIMSYLRNMYQWTIK